MIITPTEFANVLMPQKWLSAINNLSVRHLEISRDEANLFMEYLFGKKDIAFAKLVQITKEDVRTALKKAGADRVALIKDQEIVDLLARVTPYTLICETCGEFPLSHIGQTVSEITEVDRTCPFCNDSDIGHVKLMPMKLRVLAWTNGKLVLPDTRKDSKDIELQDEDILGAINDRMDRTLQAALKKIGLPIYGLLAYMRLVHNRIHNDNDVERLLRWPKEFGLEGERFEEILEEAKEHLENQEITNLPPKPKEEKKPRGSGKVIGNWRVIGILGEGRLGRTYLAEHVELHGCQACIKHCYLVTPQNIAALKREAEAMWNLGHSAFPVVRDFLTLPDGSVAIVMKHFAGPTLRQVLDKVGMLDPYHASWIAERVLCALGYLHTMKKIHGYVYPEHIILTDIPNHQIGLVGFSQAVTEAGIVSVGVADRYSSPEQVNGEPLDYRSDIFSLGRVIIETMVGLSGLESPTIPDGIQPIGLRRLIKAMVSRDITERPDWIDQDPLMAMIKIREKEFGSPDSRAISRPFPSF